MLTYEEIMAILTLVEEKYGCGYAPTDAEINGVKIGPLQAKLSIMAEVAKTK
jgi:hypothetical protein